MRDAVAAAARLRVDAATPPIVSALHAHGVPTVLLKGPALGAWLYDVDEVRQYGDIDLLVPLAALAEAERALLGLGFVKAFSPRRKVERQVAAHAVAWIRRRDGIVVDLHVGFPGLGTGDAVWEVLSEGAQELRIAGCEAQVRVPSPSRGALIVAMHALHHPGHRRCANDLERCIQRCHRDEWLEAVEAATRLGAEGTLHKALRLVPAGRDLLKHLPLEPEQAEDAFDWTLAIAALDLADDRRSRARRVALFHDMTGLDRARLALDYVAPSPEAMRWSYPIARRGWIGLAVAYPWRSVRVSILLLPELWALQVARRQWKKSRVGGPWAEAPSLQRKSRKETGLGATYYDADGSPPQRHLTSFAAPNKRGTG